MPDLYPRIAVHGSGRVPLDQAYFGRKRIFHMLSLHGTKTLAPKTKPRISPLRCAPVEMTNSFGRGVRICRGTANFALKTKLSSRPERSVAERSAVLLSNV